MSVNRSQYKQAILANLVHKVGLQQGMPRTPQECAVLLQLSNRGLARGESRMRTMGVCGGLLAADAVTPWVNDTFRRIGMVPESLTPPSQSLSPSASVVSTQDGPLLATLRVAALEVLTVGKENNIGINQRARTRAICAVFIVVRRAAISGILPKNWGVPREITVSADQQWSIDMVATACEIRAQTMKTHIAVLRDYHSRFAPVYIKHGLYSANCEKL